MGSPQGWGTIANGSHLTFSWRLRSCCLCSACCSFTCCLKSWYFS